MEYNDEEQFMLGDEEVNGKKILKENNEPSNYIDVESAFDIINKDIDMIYQNEL